MYRDTNILTSFQGDGLDFLSGQQIQKRRYSGTPSSNQQPRRRAARYVGSVKEIDLGFNTFMNAPEARTRERAECIKPSPTNKVKQASNMGKIRQDAVSSRGTKFREPVKRVYAGRDNASIRTNQKTAKRYYPAKLSFSQTVKMISYPLGFIAMTLIVAFLALNRDKLSNSVVNPLDDNAYQSAMAAYAGISPVPQENINVEVTLEANPDNAPIPLNLTETFSWKEYTIQRGDTISAIAAFHSLSMDALIALNGISNARRIREGTVIRIPNMDGIPYTVKAGDSLSKIEKKFGVPLEAIADANNLQSEVIHAGLSLFIPGASMNREDLKKALGEFFIYPIQGRFTSPFGWRPDPFTNVRSRHSGIDLAASIGTPIKASADGTVSTTGTNAIYGKYVIITHSGGFTSLYAHLSSISVNKNAVVLQGAVIGEVGNTGYSTGPHLHFGIFKNGTAVNPLDHLTR